MRRNHYPKYIVDGFFKSWENGQGATPETKRKYVGVTYVAGSTDILANLSRKETRATNTMMSRFPKLKDNDDILKKSNVIYQIPCAGCDTVYIGQTKMYLGVRLKEHKRAIEKSWETPEAAIKIGECAVVEHYRNTEHDMNFQKTKILDRESRVGKRQTLEAVHI